MTELRNSDFGIWQLGDVNEWVGGIWSVCVSSEYPFNHWNQAGQHQFLMIPYASRQFIDFSWTRSFIDIRHRLLTASLATDATNDVKLFPHFRKYLDHVMMADVSRSGASQLNSRVGSEHQKLKEYWKIWGDACVRVASYTDLKTIYARCYLLTLVSPAQRRSRVMRTASNPTKSFSFFVFFLFHFLSFCCCSLIRCVVGAMGCRCACVSRFLLSSQVVLILCDGFLRRCSRFTLHTLLSILGAVFLSIFRLIRKFLRQNELRTAIATNPTNTNIIYSSVSECKKKWLWIYFSCRCSHDLIV